jgi:hypothetical protein
MEKQYIFVLQLTGGGMVAARRKEIEIEISRNEEFGLELQFETIARIFDPPGGLPIDFATNLIEFLDPKLEVSYDMRVEAAFAVVNLLLGLAKPL